MRVALVLGAAVWEGGVPSPTLRRRALHAARLWQRGAVQAVIGCGGVGDHPPAEARVIAGILRAEGVPEGAIRIEDRSITTRQNLRNAAPILRKLGGPEAVIVTDPWHAPRARLIARQEGLRAISDCPRRAPLRLRLLLWQLPREGLALLATALRLR